MMFVLCLLSLALDPFCGCFWLRSEAESDFRSEYESMVSSFDKKLKDAGFRHEVLQHSLASYEGLAMCCNI